MCARIPFRNDVNINSTNPKHGLSVYCALFTVNNPIRYNEWNAHHPDTQSTVSSTKKSRYDGDTIFYCLWKMKRENCERTYFSRQEFKALWEPKWWPCFYICWLAVLQKSRQAQTRDEKLYPVFCICRRHRAAIHALTSFMCAIYTRHAPANIIENIVKVM